MHFVFSRDSSSKINTQKTINTFPETFVLIIKIIVLYSPTY